jgi:histidinol-phosphate/aromatic aminotransferase/cobyric acid decarboxylase-like protein
VKNHPNLIVARTFSKIYGMAGLRLWLLCNTTQQHQADEGSSNI